MLDLIFLVSMAALLAFILAWTRSASIAALLVGLAFTVAGTLIQFLATFGIGWTRSALHLWLLFGLAAAAVVAWIHRRLRGNLTPVARPSLRVVLPLALGIAAVLVLVRWSAPSDVLQSVGYLITQPSAEDNAKWLNTSAQLATDAPIDTYSAVGGPLLLVMSVAAALVVATSTVITGGLNEVAVSANTILVAQAILIAAVPFALAPVFESGLTRRLADGHRVREVAPYPLGILGVTLLASASLLVTQYGHLTLQFVLLSFTLWISVFALRIRTMAALLLTTLIVAMTAQVWFPLSVLAVVLLGGTVAWGVWLTTRPAQRRAGTAIVLSAVAALVLMNDFLRSSIAYSLSPPATTAMTSLGGSVRGVITSLVHAGTDPTIAIFASPGGTEVMTILLISLLVVSLVVVFSMTSYRGIDRSSVLPFVPAAILLGYASGVILLDFWSVGKGPGYASNKMLFATGITLLSVFLPLALLSLDSSQKRLTATRWAAIAGVVFLLIADSFLPRAAARLKPASFPVASSDPLPYWSLAEVRHTADQPLTSNPLGCVFLPQGADKPSALPDGQLAYSCSRILTGLGGTGVTAASFVAWQLDEWLQNTHYWDYYYPALAGLPEDVRNRTVILLDDEKNVSGLATLQSLLDRYPADPDYVR